MARTAFPAAIIAVLALLPVPAPAQDGCRLCYGSPGSTPGERPLSIEIFADLSLGKLAMTGRGGGSVAALPQRKLEHEHRSARVGALQKKPSAHALSKPARDRQPKPCAIGAVGGAGVDQPPAGPVLPVLGRTLCQRPDLTRHNGKTRACLASACCFNPSRVQELSVKKVGNLFGKRRGKHHCLSFGRQKFKNTQELWSET